mgnify:CR=1 FL=1
MFYTINENFVDNFFKDIYTTKPTNRLNSQFEAEVLEDGKQKVTVECAGGELQVLFQKQESVFNELVLIGPAEIVYKGEVLILI